MTDQIQSKDVERAMEQSVQSRSDGPSTTLSIVFSLAAGGGLVPPWWSRVRDIELRRFFKRIDHLAGAIFTLQSKISTIPFKITPTDSTVASWRRQADMFQEMLENEAEFGRGWNAFIEPWLEDFLVTDNGGFFEVIGEGRPDGPIVGPALGVAHLDAAQVRRTGDPEFPVLYNDPDGDVFKLHRSRVAFQASMPSPIASMHGVGLSAVSRCINVSQNISDILTFKQERLGSRPRRGIIVAGGGLDPKKVAEALAVTEDTLDSQGYSIYAKTPIVGSPNLPEGALSLVDLASLPDGFDEQTSITLGMFAIALAFGVDARELFPASGAGATRADALVQHIKARGKGIGQIISMLERMVNSYVLPPHLKIIFDFQDDAQDAQQAEIRSVRSKTRDTNIIAGVTNVRTERETMVENGDITQAQFEDLELKDGRMPDGTPVLSLFFNPSYTDLLDLGVADPINTRVNDAAMMLDAIASRRDELTRDLGEVTNFRVRDQIRVALVALDKLEDRYQSPGAGVMDTDEQEDMTDDRNGDGEEVELGEAETLTVPDMGPGDLEIRSLDGDGDLLLEAVRAMREAKAMLAQRDTATNGRHKEKV